ncbi:MAG: biotin/lipoate--protein ligase family protein [Pseudomonadota bacterium]
MGSSDALPQLPPLFFSEAAEHPFAHAIARARAGTEPGLVTYQPQPRSLNAALVLAPEVPLEDAMAMLLAAGNGFGDAFGALAPSETACQFEWPGGIRINGARCGKLRAAASTYDPAAEPDWLVIGLDVPLSYETGPDAEPGSRPDETTLWAEGCGDITTIQLLESWTRHTLVWIHEWLDAGMSRIHRDWVGRAWQVSAPIAVTVGDETASGVFTGLDERGGLILKDGTRTRHFPLSATLEKV